MKLEEITARVVTLQTERGFRSGRVVVSTDIFQAIPTLALHTPSKPFAQALALDWYHDPTLPKNTVKIEDQEGT